MKSILTENLVVGKIYLYKHSRESYIFSYLPEASSIPYVQDGKLDRGHFSFIGIFYEASEEDKDLFRRLTNPLINSFSIY